MRGDASDGRGRGGAPAALGCSPEEKRPSEDVGGAKKRTPLAGATPRPLHVCDPSCVLPPEPKSSPLVQTLRWSFKPLPFMQECREKFGDSFSVKFMTFERPMVMISDPAAIKALYTEREHGLPPGREIILTPIVGARSLLVTEGADHLAHRK